jgi:hypothetical protein
MRKKCPYCGVEVNENNLLKHKTKCLRCPKCNTVLEKGRLNECPFCHAMLKNYRKYNKSINKKTVKSNNSQKPLPEKDAPVYKPIEITATIKKPKLEKNIKELDGIYGSPILRNQDGRFVSNTSYDDYGEESDS